jgi:prevent-host-death family protein
MKRVKIADLKNQLSRHLRAVEAGAEIEVTDRRRPIVRLVPTRPTEAAIRIIPARRPFVEVRSKRARPVRPSVDIVGVLLAERGQR